MRGEVLYTCSYVPEEIIVAAGFTPRRFLPAGTTVNTWMHPNTCGYVKSLLATALEHGGVDAAGIIIANSCDAMRRLYDLWGEHVRAVPALFLDVPKTADEHSVALFAAELQGLAERLPPAFGGRAIESATLRAAIRSGNERRVAMAEVFAAQRVAQADGLGTRVFDLCLAAGAQMNDEFATSVRRFLAESTGGPAAAGAPRIVLAGGLVNRRDVVAEIERAGARVVALDTCLGLRHHTGAVDEDTADPFLALARRYLTKPSCARMLGLQERVRALQEVARQAHADGIIFCSVKFCGSCVYDIPTLADSCRAAGLPFLWLEHEYEATGLDQLRDRLGSFVELRR